MIEQRELFVQGLIAGAIAIVFYMLIRLIFFNNFELLGVFLSFSFAVLFRYLFELIEVSMLKLKGGKKKNVR